MKDKSDAKLRVLIVDDSALNRHTISEIVSSSPELQVLGTASDGDEALRLASQHRPDVITLDLEMPRMDGFTFLRILMATQPTPVIVVSSHANKENVFRALELGAVDFVEKTDHSAAASVAMRAKLLEKILMVRGLVRVRPDVSAGRMPRDPRVKPAVVTRSAPPFVVAIAASTGGPPALLDLFTRISPRFGGAVLVVQHMPERFTPAFSERLNRFSSIVVSEARDLDVVTARRAFVCPGGRNMELRANASGELHLRVLPATERDTYVPSADRLFSSVARVAGAKAIGIVLTGMGNDGLEGARAIRAKRGQVVVESEATAVVHGMPGAIIRAGLADQVLSLSEIGEMLASLGG